jgi:hypothetical protein
MIHAYMTCYVKCLARYGAFTLKKCHNNSTSFAKGIFLQDWEAFQCN